MRSIANAIRLTRSKPLSKNSKTRLCPNSNRPFSPKPNTASWARKKNQTLIRNGKRPVQLQTLHGSFVFQEQQYLDVLRQPTSYLRQSGQSWVSFGLEEYCLFCCTRMSYQTVVTLVQRNTGQALVCRQTLTNWVERKARQIDATLQGQVDQAQNLPTPALVPTVDLYDAAAEEVLVFTDGICVKAQKPTHEKAGEVRKEKVAKRHDTDVMLFEGADHPFDYLSGSSDNKITLAALASAFLRREWGQRTTPLPMVALTDGAKKIRQDLAAVFGENVTIVLDWYHLSKRVYEQLSMSAHSKEEREQWEQSVLGHLWKGQVSEALSFLNSLSPRNAKALADLVGYLQKHQSEIIDYGRRQATGKSIGSGRMEKGVDQVIGMRQKKKGMSWSEIGSRALALLKIAELNGLWRQLWNEAGCPA